MKKLLFPIALLLIYNTISFAQMGKKNPEQTVYFLANKLLSETSWELMNVKTGETFTDSKKLPVSADIKLKSKKTDWLYQNGVLNLAMMKAGNYFNEKKYTNFVENNYKFAFKNYDYFKKQFEDQSIKKPSLFKMYEFHYLDDCGTMGAGLIESGLLESEKSDDYKALIERSADYIMNKEFRLEDGTLCREYPRKGAVWADDLYMSVIFLTKMGTYTGEAKYHNEAVKQIKQFTKYLFDENMGVYNHAYFHDIDEVNGAFWGRANGWVMMAQVELLSALSDSHPERAELIEILKSFIRGISRLQSQSGLWHQLLNKNDSFLESSCTAMFTYSIAKAVNEGWIDSVWSQVAWKGWRGLYGNVTEDAQVKDICVGTHVEWNLAFYYNRPISVNDTHGLATTILAGTEITRLSKKYSERISPRSF